MTQRCKLLLIVIVWNVCLSQVYAQTNQELQQVIKLKKGTHTVASILEQISQQASLHFSYNNLILATERKTYLTGKPLAIGQLLDKMLSPQELSFIQKGKVIIIKKKSAQNRTPSTSTSNVSTRNPRQVTVKGMVKDQVTGEILIGATVYIPSLKKGTTTNNYGFYSLTIPKGTYALFASYIGFQNIKQQVELQSNQTIDLELPVDATELKEVVVTDKVFNEEVTNIEMSLDKLSADQIKNMPTFLGEADVIQSILALPGVNNVGEASGGFNVRGGNVDQNLILLDEATVYNSFHLLGLFSVFNPHSIKDVKLYKGAIPARYGGRLSSVLDIHQKEGNVKQFSGEGGVGFVTTRLTLETPLVKDKSALLLAGRRSYADLFLKLSDDASVRNTQLYFYDFNAKFNYTLNENNRLYVSGYLGRDVVQLAKIFDFSWGNTTATVRWNHVFNSRLFSNVSAIFSDYNYLLKVPTPVGKFDWKAGIINYQLKNDLTWFINPNYTLDFGVSGILYDFQPGRILFKGTSSANIINISNEKALEGAVYINSEHIINERLKMSYGLRYSVFWNLGPRLIRTYDPSGLRRTENVLSTKTYGNYDVITSYQGLEPRLGLRWQFNNRNALKMSYNRNRQYIHLISNTTAPVPTDIWKSSDVHIQPMVADQVTLGYVYSMRKPRMTLSAEIYYKKMNNIVEYKPGAQLLLNEYLETELLSGEGRAYGLELMLKKPTGKVNGWLSYTLARTERLVNGRFPEEKINNGNYFPTDYDKPHSLNLVVNYQTTKRLSLALNFVYSTGRPFTLPGTKYSYGGQTLVEFEARNQRRIPDYHRLDLSLTIKGKGRAKRRWRSEWVFSLYNIYARRNAYSVYFGQNDQGESEAVKLSILGSIFPSVAYNFKF